MLARDDVVDLKRQVVEMLRHLTEFAGPSSALPNVLSRALSTMISFPG